MVNKYYNVNVVYILGTRTIISRTISVEASKIIGIILI
jgi:hypothetical protein